MAATTNAPPPLQLVLCFLLFQAVSHQCAFAQDDEEIPKIGKNTFVSLKVIDFNVASAFVRGVDYDHALTDPH